jgi:hypothetical protein
MAYLRAKLAHVSFGEVAQSIGGALAVCVLLVLLWTMPRI